MNITLNFFTILLLILLLGSISTLVYFFNKYHVLKGLANNFDEKIKTQTDYFNDTLQNQVKQTNALQQKLEQTEQEFEIVKSNLIISDNNLKNLTTQYEDLKEELLHEQRLKEALTTENVTLKEEQVKLEGEIKNLNQQIQMEKDLHVQNYQELEQRLTIIGEKMLNQRQEDFTKSSSLKLKEILNPIEKGFVDFRTLITDNQKFVSEQSGKFSVELKKLQESQLTLSKQAEDLTKALSTNSKSQGMWGEHQLELVLDNSGLIKGEQYDRELAGDKSNGEYGRVDAIIYLPKQHCIIIDAKCSLSDFTNYVNAENDSQKNQALTNHLKSISKHIDELAERHYENYKSYNSPSFVFMFVPIDEALNLALRSDQKLYERASKKNVYLVSPSSLMPALRIVSNLWILSNQNERIRKLAMDAQNIYEKTLRIKGDFEDVLKKKESLDKSILNLGNKLYSGRDNLMNKIAKFNANAPAVIDEIDGVEINVGSSATLEDQSDKRNLVTVDSPNDM